MTEKSFEFLAALLGLSTVDFVSLPCLYDMHVFGQLFT